MQNAESRVARVVRGVVEQAMRDAGASALELVGAASLQSRLIARWCGVQFATAPGALLVSAQNKTDLLLAGPTARADLYPLGDLYASQVAGFCGDCELTDATVRLVAAAGSVEQLDQALRWLLDERRDEATAFAALPELRATVLDQMQQTRFRRAHTGIIPKLGARTIGIDLFI